jgi:hypothetical protein
MAADHQPQGCLCRWIGACDVVWQRIDGVLICQCRRRGCRRLVAAMPDPIVRPAALAALQSTDGRPAADWPGCTD